MVDFKRMYHALGNDRDLQNEVLREYLMASTDAIDRLIFAFESANIADSRRVLRKIQAMAANVYAIDLSHLLSLIEQELEQSKQIPPDLRQKFLDVRNQTDEVIRQFLKEGTS